MSTVKQRIAVLVSGGGTNLQALLDAQKAGKIPSGEIVLVLSNNPEAYALQRAANFDVKGLAWDGTCPDGLNRRQALEAWLLQNLKAEAIDVIILAGFMFILSPAFIEAYRDRIINVHPALIPSFCGEGFYGLHVHEAALGYGVKVTGATVHLVNEIPDGGRILLQTAVDILPGDTPEVLQKRVMEQAEWILLPQAAELLCQELGKQA